MNIFELECFLSLAKYLNFTKAAEQMYITQPVFSRHITRIEEDLGSRLFFRDKRSVSLTPTGSVFLTYAEAIVNSYYEGKEAVLNEHKGIVGRLTIGVLKELHNERLLKSVNEFIALYPKMGIRIYEYTNYEIFGAILSHEIDVAFTISTADFENQHLIWIKEQSIQHSIVLPLYHHLANRASIQLSDLHDQNFVFLETEAYLPINQVLLRIFDDKDILPVIVGRAASIQGLLSMVECGVGISIVPEHFKNLYPNNLVFINLDSNEPEVNRVTAWRKDNDNIALQLFLDLLQ